jgi:hypothetical protein
VAANNYAFVGEAPGVVGGGLQINVTIPQLAPTGSNVLVVVNIGNYSRQRNSPLQFSSSGQFRLKRNQRCTIYSSSRGRPPA